MAEKVSKIFIPDTNVILYDSSCIKKFKEHDIILPIQVVEELDSFKKGFEAKNFHAREFCRTIDELLSDIIFSDGVSLGEGLGKLKVVLAVPMHEKVKDNLNVNNVDAQIINLAFTLKETTPGREIIIVSKDVNLRLKAKALGIMAQDFLHETVRDISTLMEEVKTVEVDSEFLNRFYHERTIKNEFIENPLQNQNFILQNGKQSALARHKNGSLNVIQKDKLHAFGIKAKNSEQVFTLDVLLDPSISLIAIEGNAGTGKTILSIASALEQSRERIYDKIFFSRQTISMGDREIGYLKGGVDEKIGPFMMAMNDNLDVISSTSDYNKDQIIKFQSSERLVIEPLSFIRGRSLNKVFFIIDEAQNLTPHEVKTITTRAGEGTKIVFLGDTHQIDHPYLDQKSNGLSYLIQRFKGQSCFSHIHLVKNERSSLAELAGKLL